MNIKDFENEKLYDFFRSSKVYDFKKGEIILRAGDVPQGAYCIQAGHVKVYSLTDNGDENLHIVYKTGELFPLVWVFKDILRNVFYEAMDNVRVWRVPREELTKLAAKEITVANTLLRQAVEQFYVYADRVDNLEYTSAYDRVVYRLLFLASRFGTKNGKTTVIDAAITHQHVANSINLARETASRQIEKLVAKGLVELKDHQLILKDVEKLRDEIGEPTSLDLWGLK